ncbi:hypothetical protein DK853_48120, partial [Klebsiella oxytoca]
SFYRSKLCLCFLKGFPFDRYGQVTLLLDSLSALLELSFHDIIESVPVLVEAIRLRLEKPMFPQFLPVFVFVVDR